MRQEFESLKKIGLVPVIKIDDAEKAVPLARALINGNIPCAEITFRTDSAEEAIRKIKNKYPDVLLGAGTVLSTEQVDKAINAGAAFIVSPGFNPKVVSYCKDKDFPVIPGCATPTDIEQALSFGLDIVKFFPAEQAGGLDYIKAVAAPYSSVKFMPTGGINEHNIAKYTAFEKIIACGGSWMVPADLIESGNYDRITELCQEAVLKMLNFTITNIGSDVSIETSSVFKAAAFFKRKGMKLVTETLKTDTSGIWVYIKIEDEFLGRVIQLTKK